MIPPKYPPKIVHHIVNDAEANGSIVLHAMWRLTRAPISMPVEVPIFLNTLNPSSSSFYRLSSMVSNTPQPICLSTSRVSLLTAAVPTSVHEDTVVGNPGYRRGYFSDSKTRHRKVFRSLLEASLLVGAHIKQKKPQGFFCFMCAPSRDRTCDRQLKRLLLYRLSYRGMFLAHRNTNTSF